MAFEVSMNRMQRDTCNRKAEESSSFWTGKDPCWILLGCSRYVYPECPAYLHPEIPCWDHAFTQSEKLLGFKRECRSCKVFKIYNNQAPSPAVTFFKAKKL